MRIRSYAICALLCFSALSAGAHSTGDAAAKPAVAAPAAARPGTHDPRAYFTDSELVTQDGRRIRFYSDALRNRVVILNVMYTNCTDACPLITRQLNQVRNDLGGMFGREVYFVSITSDPGRDTPSAMRKFARAQNADVAGWTFLTGHKEDVELILRRLGALSPSVDEHATQLYIMDVDRKRMRRMLPNLPPKAIAEAARQIAGPAS